MRVDYLAYYLKGTMGDYLVEKKGRKMDVKMGQQRAGMMVDQKETSKDGKKVELLVARKVSTMVFHWAW
jgi:hypothetical protein